MKEGGGGVGSHEREVMEKGIWGRVLVEEEVLGKGLVEEWSEEWWR